MCSGDHIIEEKLKALEHYRLDKPHVEDDFVSVATSSAMTEATAETAAETEEVKAEGAENAVAKEVDESRSSGVNLTICCLLGINNIGLCLSRLSFHVEC